MGCGRRGQFSDYSCSNAVRTLFERAVFGEDSLVRTRKRTFPCSNAKVAVDSPARTRPQGEGPSRGPSQLGARSAMLSPSQPVFLRKLHAGAPTN